VQTVKLAISYSKAASNPIRSQGVDGVQHNSVGHITAGLPWQRNMHSKLRLANEKHRIQRLPRLALKNETSPTANMKYLLNLIKQVLLVRLQINCKPKDALTKNETT